MSKQDEALEQAMQSLHELLAAITPTVAHTSNEVNAALNQIRVVLSALEGLREAAAYRDNLNWLHQRAVMSLLTQVGSAAGVIAPVSSDLDRQFAQLAARAPANFAAWLTCYKAGRAEYDKRLPTSLSTPQHRVAFDFRAFVTVYAKGRILDLGVGPLAKPSYLDGTADDRIAGVDPLPPYESHPFVFSQSVAEFLPWPDGCFETVIAATSLDHVYLLDVALDEIRRVLTPSGRFLIWAGIFPETPPYDPYAGPITPLDAYHLFHPGENWFVPTLSQRFPLIERFEAAPLNSFLALERSS
jgi:SAM-dependent methyltransferase